MEAQGDSGRSLPDTSQCGLQQPQRRPEGREWSLEKKSERKPCN